MSTPVKANFSQRLLVVRRPCNVTNFGADVSFARVEDKLVEHYGVLIGESTIRRITEHHGAVMAQTRKLTTEYPQQAGQPVVISEMGGTMVQTVMPDETAQDRRRGKHLQWQEAKVCLVRVPGETQPVYGGTLQGGVDSAGQQMFHCACEAGLGRATQVHAVGDGAAWIAGQVDAKFGDKGIYLIDFYHMSEYLGAAAAALHPDKHLAQQWLHETQALMKRNQSQEVIAALSRHCEPVGTPDATAPIRCCHRY